MKGTSQFCSTDPLVSVLLPVSRVDKYFHSAVESILNQCYGNLELLLLANGVTDEEFAVIELVRHSDCRVRIFRLRLRGLVFALNFGIEVAQGEFLARMDSDDVSLPGRIRAQVNFLSQNPQCGVVGGRIFLIDETGKRLEKQFRYFESDLEIKKVLPYRNPMCHPALMFRKDALMTVEGYKFGYMSEDHDLFIRMMNVGTGFHNIDFPVFEYRRHSSQITDISRAKKHFAEISGFMIINFIKSWNLKYIAGAMAVSPAIRRLRNFILASGFLRRP